MESRRLAVTTDVREFTIDYTEFASLSAADTSEAVTLFTLKDGEKALAVEVKHTVQWAGTSLSDMAVSVGVTGSATALTSSYASLDAAVAATTLQETGGLFKSTTSGADIAVIATFTSTGCDLTDLSAGEVRIRVLVAKITSPLS